MLFPHFAHVKSHMHYEASKKSIICFEYLRKHMSTEVAETAQVGRTHIGIMRDES